MKSSPFHYPTLTSSCLILELIGFVRYTNTNVAAVSGETATFAYLPHIHTCVSVCFVLNIMPRTLRLDDWAKANPRLMREELAEKWGWNNLEQGTFPRGHKEKVRTVQG